MKKDLYSYKLNKRVAVDVSIFGDVAHVVRVTSSGNVSLIDGADYNDALRVFGIASRVGIRVASRVYDFINSGVDYITYGDYKRGTFYRVTAF